MLPSNINDYRPTPYNTGAEIFHLLSMQILEQDLDLIIQVSLSLVLVGLHTTLNICIFISSKVGNVKK